MRIYGNACNTYVHMDLIVDEIGTSIQDNTSEIRWQLVGYLSTTNAAYWYANQYHDISIVINGMTVYSRSKTENMLISIGTNANHDNVNVIAAGNCTVPHNADGTKNLTASFNCAYKWSPSFAWSGSGSMNLTMIARASVPTLNKYSFDFGTSITISTNAVNSAFTHTIKYSFANGKTGTIAQNVKGSTSWLVPLSYSDTAPNSEYSSGSVVCETYYNGQKIGSKSVSFTAHVPETSKPTISGIACTDGKNLLPKYGGYVQTKSTVKVDVTAAGILGSTIKSYSIAVNGETYNSNGCTTKELMTAGENTVSVTVTDSRGRKASGTANINVIEYSIPTINYVNAFRANSMGIPDDQGEKVCIGVKSSISPISNKNSKSFLLQYKKSTDANYTTLQDYTTSYNCILGNMYDASPDYSYDILLTVTDDFSKATFHTSIDTAYTLIDFKSDGKGVAIGKASELDALEVNKPVYGYEDIVAFYGTDDETYLGKVSVLSLGTPSELSGPEIYLSKNACIKSIRVNSSLKNTVSSEGMINLGTISDVKFLPKMAVYKRVFVNKNVSAQLTITLSGEVSLLFENSLESGKSVRLNEIYI